MIKLENVTKKFGPLKAVDNISFEVNKGEVLGFLGPNAAGKSTTMRMITGFFPPSHGRITVAGYNVNNHLNKIKSLIGYLPESSPAYKEMTPYSFLKFAASIRGIRHKALKNALDKVIALCNLEDVLFQSIDTLSKGFFQRVCLAQSIIHDPPILILDEPTDGLDPNQKHQTRELIKNMSKDKTIIISTHILEEIDACCSRVIIISKGKLVADNIPSELVKLSKTANTLMLDISDIKSANETVKLLKDIPFAAKASIISESNGIAKIRLYPNRIDTLNQLIQEITKLAQKKKWNIQDFTIDKGDLGEVFRKITTREIN